VWLGKAEAEWRPAQGGLPIVLKSAVILVLEGKPEGGSAETKRKCVTNY
jgi:hypothetical protein